MKRMKKLVIIYLALFFFQYQASSQQFLQGFPIGKSNASGNIPLSSTVPIVSFDEFNTVEEQNYLIENDDCKDCGFKRGVFGDVNLNIVKSSSRTLINNVEVFEIDIEIPSAYAAEFVFDNIHLGDHTQLYILNAQGQTLGGITNKDIKNNSYISPPLSGDYFKIKIYEPDQHSEKLEIHISQYVHYFVPLSRSNLISSNDTRFYDLFLSCLPENTLADPKFDGSQEFEKAIGAILTSTQSGTKMYRSFCTGALINNTAHNGIPYFLTARHCFNGEYTEENNGIGIGMPANNDLNNTTILFNYEQGAQHYYYLTGAEILSLGQESDYALLKLNQRPQDHLDVYYLGWDRNLSNIINSAAYNISHPGGMMKTGIETSGPLTTELIPITIYKDTIYNHANSFAHFWKIDYSDFNTAPGSSGSPLILRNTDKVIGTLCCGLSSCKAEVYTANNKEIQLGGSEGNDFYGQFGHSWNHPSYGGLGNGGSLINYPTVASFLDPLGTNPMSITGYEPPTKSHDQFELIIIGAPTTVKDKFESYTSIAYINNALVSPNNSFNFWTVYDENNIMIYQSNTEELFYAFDHKAQFVIELHSQINANGIEHGIIARKIINVLGTSNTTVDFFVQSSTSSIPQYANVDFFVDEVILNGQSVNAQDFTFTWDLGQDGKIISNNNNRITGNFSTQGFKTINVTAQRNLLGTTLVGTQQYENFEVVDPVITDVSLDVRLELLSGTAFPLINDVVEYVAVVYKDGIDISDELNLKFTWDLGTDYEELPSANPRIKRIKYLTSGYQDISIQAEYTENQNKFIGVNHDRFKVLALTQEPVVDLQISGCPGNIFMNPFVRYILEAEIVPENSFISSKNFKWYRNNQAINETSEIVYGTDVASYKVELYSGYGSGAKKIAEAQNDRCAFQEKPQDFARIEDIHLENTSCAGFTKIVGTIRSNYNQNSFDLSIDWQKNNFAKNNFSMKEVTRDGFDYLTRFELPISTLKIGSYNALFVLFDTYNGQRIALDNKTKDLTITGVNVSFDSHIYTCLNTSIQLNKNGPSANNYSYYWTGNTQKLTISNSSAIFTTNQSGTYEYSVRVVDDISGCESPLNHTIQVHVTDIELNKTQFALCNGVLNEIELKVSGGSGTGYQFNWNDPDNVISYNSNYNNDFKFNIISNFNSLQNFTKQVEIVDNSNCSKVFNIDFTSSNPLVFNFQPNITSLCGDPVNIQGPSSGSDYIWTRDGDYFSSSQDITTEYPGTYTLSATNSKGCRTSKSVYVEAFKIASGTNPGSVLYNKTIDIPISGPKEFHDLGDVDGDGVNDMLMRAGTGKVPLLYILRLDRYGNLKTINYIAGPDQLPSPFKSGGYEMKSLIVVKKFKDGTFQIAFSTERDNTSSSEFKYSHYNNQKVWVLKYSFYNESVSLISESRTGKSGGENHHGIDLFELLVEPALFKMTASELNDVSQNGMPSNGCKGPSIPVYGIFKNEFKNVINKNFSNYMRVVQSRGLVPQNLGDDFGAQLAMVPDMDNDGNDELIVSAPKSDEGDLFHTNVFPKFDYRYVLYKNVYIDIDLKSKRIDNGSYHLLFLNEKGQTRFNQKVSPSNGNYVLPIGLSSLSTNYGLKLKDTDLEWYRWASIDGNDSYSGSSWCNYTQKYYNGTLTYPALQGQNHLCWAGDLDGDGFSDLLTSGIFAWRKNDNSIDSRANFKMFSFAGPGFKSVYLSHLSGYLSTIKSKDIKIYNLGDLFGDGGDELFFTDNFSQHIINFDQSNLDNFQDINPSISNRGNKLSVAGDWNNDGVKDIIEQLTNGSVKIHFLDGVPKPGEAFLENELTVCERFGCGFDNRLSPIRAKIIKAGNEYCNNTFTIGEGFERSVSASLSLFAAGNPYLVSDVCRFSFKPKIEMRATQEIILKPGVKISALEYTGTASGEFDFRAKILDLDALESCFSNSNSNARWETSEALEDSVYNNEVNDAFNKNDLSIYPNPSVGILNIVFNIPSKQGGNISVLDLQGKVVFSEEIFEFEQMKIINLKYLPSSTYIVKVEDLETLQVYYKQFQILTTYNE